MLRALAILVLAAPAFAQQPSSHLPEILARLDTTSAQFRSAQADFHKVLTNALIHDQTTQDGSLFVAGKGSSTRFGLKIDGPGARILDYDHGTLRVFNPALGCYDQVPTSNQAQVESFLALGFGGSGTELQSQWNITDKGPETLTAGGRPVKVEVLDLAPKSPSVANTVTHVTLWMDLARGIALKLELFSPSGDTQTAVYSNIRLNTPVDTKPFQFKNKSCAH